MRLSANRIRSINRSIAKVNGIICGASDGSRQVPVESGKHTTSAIPARTLRIVVARKPISA